MDPDGLRIKRIPELLEEDWEGAQMTARLFKQAEEAVLQGARAVVDGGWDRKAMVRTEAWCLARAVLEPDAVYARIKFRFNKKKCPVLRAVFESKRLVGPDTRPWLAEVAKTHEVLT
jgi:hypothetical protein